MLKNNNPDIYYLLIIENIVICLIVATFMNQRGRSVGNADSVMSLSNGPIQIERTMRLLDRYGYEGTERKLYGQSVCFSDGYYYSCGGYDSNRRQSIAICNSEGSIIKSFNYTELYHANSITILNDNIIVANGNGPYITVLDKNSLEICKKVTLGDEIKNAIAVDTFNNELYIRARSDEDNNVVLKMISIETEEYEVLCTLPGVANTVKQGFCVYNGFAYFLYNHSNMIYKADLEKGEYVAAFSIPDSDGWNPLGEPEDLYVCDGTMYITCAVYPVNGDKARASMVSIFATDVLNDLQKKFVEYQPVKYTQLIVDGFSETRGNPKDSFNTMEEACAVLNTKHYGTIIMQNIDTGYCYLYDGTYSIVGNKGDRELNTLDIKNSSVIASQLSNISEVNIDTSRVTLRAFSISGALNVKRSDLELCRSSIVGNAVIDQTRSSITYNQIQYIDSSVVVKSSQPISNTTTIRTSYVDNLLNLLYGGNSDITITIYTPDLVLQGLIPAKSLSTGSFVVNTENDAFPEIHYRNGLFLLLDDDSSEIFCDDSYVFELSNSSTM